MSNESVKFLLVDDLEENLLALEALLRRDGLKLLKARSGAEALELLLVHDFALALLDVQMPGMNGFELAELMRGTERTRRVPIIFLTAVATDERRRFGGYEAGAVDFIIKPIDPQALRSKAEVFYELYRQRQEVSRQRDELRDPKSGYDWRSKRPLPVRSIGTFRRTALSGPPNITRCSATSHSASSRLTKAGAAASIPMTLTGLKPKSQKPSGSSVISTWSTASSAPTVRRGG